MNLNKQNILKAFFTCIFSFLIFAGSVSQAKKIENIILCPICKKVAHTIIHNVKDHLGSISSGIAHAECPKIAKELAENDCITLVRDLMNDIVNSTKLSSKSLCKAIHRC